MVYALRVPSCNTSLSVLRLVRTTGACSCRPCFAERQEIPKEGEDERGGSYLEGGMGAELCDCVGSLLGVKWPGFVWVVVAVGRSCECQGPLPVRLGHLGASRSSSFVAAVPSVSPARRVRHSECHPVLLPPRPQINHGSDTASLQRFLPPLLASHQAPSSPFITTTGFITHFIR